MVIKKHNIKIIIVGIITSIVSFAFTYNYEIEKEKLHFITSANNLFNKIESIFSTLERTNKELGSRFYLSDEMTKGDFKFLTLSIIQQNNFIESILFSESITAKSKSDYELEFQKDGYTGFKIKPFPQKKHIPSPEKEYLLPVKYIEPYSVKNSRYFGLNLLTHATVADLFSSKPPPEHLTYKADNNANGFYAIELLYRGHNNSLQSNYLSNLYGVLLYKIKLKNITNDYYYLKIKTNNEIIFDIKNNVKNTFDITLISHKKIKVGEHDISVELQQGKTLFSIDPTYPTIVLILGLLLTGLIWKIISSHEEINILLREQKNIIEDEVELKTAEIKTKADELEAFSYSVSHDLRAPLHSIDGFSQLLQTSYSDSLDDEANSYIQHISTAATKMDHIINDLLSLSHISKSTIETENHNISEIAERAVDTMRDYEPERKISIDIKKDVFAQVDPNLLQLCFDNLFSNAWKYSSKINGAHIEFGTTEKNRETVYYVKDNGIGFNMYDSNKLFVPFQRLHHNSEFEGTGIGLMIVKRIIEKHGGKIWAESEQNKGAVFYFTLNANA